MVRALNCSYHPNQIWTLDKVSNYIAGDIVDGVGTNVVPPVTQFTQFTTVTSYSLNTNFGFPRWPNSNSGAVKLGIYDSNPADQDQCIGLIPLPNGSYMLKQATTGYCIDSTNNVVALQEVIVWQCTAGNVNQQWDLLSVGNGYRLVRRRGTNLCIDVKGQQFNEQITHLYPCDSNNANQRLKFGHVGFNRADSISNNEFVSIQTNIGTLIENGISSWEAYENQIKALEEGLSVREILLTAKVMNNDGTLRSITDQEWVQLIDEGRLGTINPSTRMFIQNGKYIGTVAANLERLKILLTITKDFQNFYSDSESGILPFVDTVSLIAGIKAGTTTTTVIMTKGCIPAATGGTASIPCGVGAIAAGVAVSFGVEESGRLIFKQVLNRENIVRTYNGARFSPFYPRNINSVTFISNLCRTFGRQCN